MFCRWHCSSVNILLLDNQQTLTALFVSKWTVWSSFAKLRQQYSEFDKTGNYEEVRAFKWWSVMFGSDLLLNFFFLILLDNVLNVCFFFCKCALCSEKSSTTLRVTLLLFLSFLRPLSPVTTLYVGKVMEHALLHTLCLHASPVFLFFCVQT